MQLLQGRSRFPVLLLAFSYVCVAGTLLNRYTGFGAETHSSNAT
jgi:hypothetical protein